MTEKQPGPGGPSNPERDEALRSVQHLPPPTPASDEEFEQHREDARKREERDALLPEYDPVAAERMAYEMNPLTRADERFRVQDPVEAERMAHAMDPHYERASEIDSVKARTDEALDRTMQGDVELITNEEYDQGDEATQAAAGSENDSWADRVESLDNESTALEDAASSARKAGDAHGEQVSKVYRRKKESGDA
jgi:hypothetical protein